MLQQFEEFGAPDVVISLAKTAIGIADDDDPNVVIYLLKKISFDILIHITIHSLEPLRSQLLKLQIQNLCFSQTPIYLNMYLYCLHLIYVASYITLYVRIWQQYLVESNCRSTWKCHFSHQLHVYCTCNSIQKSRLNGPYQVNLVLIAYASSEGSGEPAHPRSLARTSAARSYKQWVKRNLQTESFPGPTEVLGMCS